MKQMYGEIQRILKENNVDAMEGITCVWLPTQDDNKRWHPNWFSDEFHDGFMDAARMWCFKDSENDPASVCPLPDNLCVVGRNRANGKQWLIYTKTDNENGIPTLLFRWSEVTEEREREINGEVSHTMDLMFMKNLKPILVDPDDSVAQNELKKEWYK